MKSDDDSGGNLQALIAGFALPLTGNYIIEATTYGSNVTGNYTLRLTTIDGAISGTVRNASTGEGISGATVTASPSTAASPAPAIRLLADSERFAAGNRFEIEVQTSPGTTNEPVDLYIGVRLPDESLLFFTSSPFAPFSSDLAPYQANFSVSESAIPLLDFLVEEGLEGVYDFVAAFVRPGREPNFFNIIGQIERLRITIE